jgi:hypothetical protein
MTIFQTLRNGLSRRSKYPRHWIRLAGVQKNAKPSRQVRRRLESAEMFDGVSVKNPFMPRSERRNLARAYTVGLRRSRVVVDRPLAA